MEGNDVVVAGGGSAGCVLAARLSEDPDRSVCLIEAGPDYGPYAEGRWPEDLLNAHQMGAVSHDWGIEGGWPSWRAKVLGGCSAHNGCNVVWGPPADYDDWAQAGNPGWSHGALDPYRRRAEHAIRTRPSRVEDLEPFNRAGLDAATELGLPLLEDFDDPGPPGRGADQGQRRRRGPLERGLRLSRPRQRQAEPVDHGRHPGGSAAPGGISGRRGARAGGWAGGGGRGRPGRGGRRGLRLARGVLRSGLGPAEDLAAASVEVRAELPGVGRNLVDHPALVVWWRPGAGLLEATAAHYAADPGRAEAVIRAQSQRCTVDRWDLHIYLSIEESDLDEPPSSRGSGFLSPMWSR